MTKPELCCVDFFKTFLTFFFTFLILALLGLIINFEKCLFSSLFLTPEIKAQIIKTVIQRKNFRFFCMRLQAALIQKRQNIWQDFLFQKILWCRSDYNVVGLPNYKNFKFGFWRRPRGTKRSLAFFSSQVSSASPHNHRFETIYDSIWDNWRQWASLRDAFCCIRILFFFRMPL